MSKISLVVAKKEWLELTRDRRWSSAAAIVWLLVAAALATAWPDARQRASEREALNARAREQWLEQGAKNPHTAAHFGVYAIKPSTPLAIFDPGVTSYAGTHVLLEAHWQNPQQARAADTSPASYRLGTLSPAFVLQHVLPLLIILLGYGAFAGERDRGTWALLVAQGATPAQIGMGKMLALAAAIIALVVPPLIGGAWASMMVAPDRDDVLARGLLLAAVYAAYGITCLALALWVSARARSSRRALTVLLACWIGSSLIVPRAAADLSRVIAPLPSAFAFHEAIYAQKAQGVNGHDPADRRLDALRTGTLQAYGVAREEDLPLNFSGLALQADEEYGHTVFERAYGMLWDRFDRQALVQSVAALLSPTQAVRFASMAIAGTDVAHDRHFSIEAERYRRDLVQRMNGDLTHRSRSGDFSYVGSRSTWAGVPEMFYHQPSALWAVRGAWISCALVAIWSAVSVTGLYVTLGRRRAGGA